MNVLVTGHQGYVGTILVKQLLEQNFQVLGCDTNYFDSTLSENSLKIPNLISDIRNITNEHLKNIDAIFHLAGLSNDPLGELNSKLTNEINYVSTVNLAKRAKESGVKRFVFSSSCSTYGQNDNLVDENSSLEPLTEYAKSKVNSEKKILELNDETILRNATVYGTSSNMRLDLVVNNLLASAFVSGKIELLSDGTSWRPLLHVNDMANAFITVLTSSSNLVSGQIFNVGNNDENFTVKQIANTINEIVPDTEIVYKNIDNKDSRSYKVNFSKISNELKYKTNWTLKQGIEQLHEYFSKCNLSKSDFYDFKFHRVHQLKTLMNNSKLDENLNFI